MAGDWIKMRSALADDPAVIAIAEKLGVDEFSVVGRLHHFWSWADSQTTNGHATGVTQKWINRYVHCDGFAEAMVTVGWLTLENGEMRIPNFERHNGETAKTRALATKRQQKHRNSALSESEDLSRIERDKSVTREEKRREEKNIKTNTRSVFDARRHLSEQGVEDQVISDWLDLRKKLRAPVTETAMAGIEREARKAGLHLQDALRVCCQRGWRGFDASWLDKRKKSYSDENAETVAKLTGRWDFEHERVIDA